MQHIVWAINFSSESERFKLEAQQVSLLGFFSLYGKWAEK